MSMTELISNLRRQPLEALVRHAEALDHERALTAAAIRELRKVEAERREESARGNRNSKQPA